MRAAISFPASTRSRTGETRKVAVIVPCRYSPAVTVIPKSRTKMMAPAAAPNGASGVSSSSVTLVCETTAPT
jgi:hypothetical protein